MLLFLCLIFKIFVVLKCQSYSISITCETCSLPGCSECVLYNGGPFNNFLECVQEDQDCFLQNNTPEVIEFSCLAPDGTCSYTDSYQQKFYDGTTSMSDSYWPGLQLALNLLLQLAQNSTETPQYNWCSGVGTCGGLSTGAIVGITIGSVVCVSLIGLMLGCYCRKRNQKKQKIRPALISLTAVLDQNKESQFSREVIPNH